MIKQNRNYIVDFWRFIFSLIVVMAHTNGLRPPDKNSYPFVGGYLAVEFFFILSGFFMMQSIYALEVIPAKGSIGKASIHFALRKMAPVFPYYLWSLLSFLVVYNYFNAASSYEILKNFAYSIIEIFMLQMSGINQVIYNAPTWYISVLLLTMPILYYFGLKNGDLLINILAPLAVILIYGYFSQSFEQLDVWNNYVLIVKAGVLRGIAGLCIGIICFGIYQNINQVKISKAQRLLLTILEVMGYPLIILIMLMKGHSKMDFILVFIIAALFLITYSGLSYTNSLMNNRFFYWLGQFSLPLYLTHWTIRLVVPKVFIEGSYWEWMPIYLASSLVYAGIVFIAFLFAKHMLGQSKLSKITKIKI